MFLMAWDVGSYFWNTSHPCHVYSNKTLRLHSPEKNSGKKLWIAKWKYSTWPCLESEFAEKQDWAAMCLCVQALQDPLLVSIPRFWVKCLHQHTTIFQCLWYFYVMHYHDQWHGWVMGHHTEELHCIVCGLDTPIVRAHSIPNQVHRERSQCRLIWFVTKMQSIGLTLIFNFEYLCRDTV